MWLIDADEFEDALENTEYDISPAYEPDGYSHRLICKVLEETPTVDAVPVVRCQKCIFYDPENRSNWCSHPTGLCNPGKSDFCSYGKRKKENND